MSVTPPPVLKPASRRPVWLTVLELSVLLGVCGCCGAIMWPVFLSARTADHRPACLSNLKRAALAQLLYADDHDDRFPPAAAWMDLTRKYVPNDDVFHCPIAQKRDPDAYGYAMDDGMSCRRVEDVPEPAEAPLLFESALLYRNAHSAFEGFPSPLRHFGLAVAYADGHVRFITPEQAAHVGRPPGSKQP